MERQEGNIESGDGKGMNGSYRSLFFNYEKYRNFQNFHARKSGEMKVFFAVFAEERIAITFYA